MSSYQYWSQHNGTSADPNNIVAVTIELIKGSTAYSVITSASVPGKASLQILDSPLVLELNNTLTAAAGNTGFLHTIVSVLEIT